MLVGIVGGSLWMGRLLLACPQRRSGRKKRYGLKRMSCSNRIDAKRGKLKGTSKVELELVLIGTGGLRLGAVSRF